MNLDNIKKDAREFVQGIKDAKILHLSDSAIMHLMNASTVPVFSNGGNLARVTKKTLEDGSTYDAIRPYLVCYNKALGCKVLYPMTAQQTEDTIRKHKRYQFVQVPTEVYYFIESAVYPDRFHQETHNEDSMSTVDVEKGLPIFAECFDYDDLCISYDYDNFTFASRLLPVAQEFIKDLYGRYNENTTKAVTNANEGLYSIINEGKNGYTHQHFRPAISYLVIFLNWSESAVKNDWFSDVPEIERVKSLREVTLKAYVDYLRYSKLVQHFKKQNSKLYNAYLEAKTFASRDENGTVVYNEVQNDFASMGLFDEKELEKIKDIMRLEAQIEKDIAFASKAISMFVQDSKRVIDMSLTPANTKVIADYKSMANNQLDKKGVQRLNDNFAKLCQSKIDKIEEQRELARRQKEADLERRSKEVQQRQNANRSRTDMVCANVKEAMRLYTDKYFEVVSLCENGALFNPSLLESSDKFVKLYTSYDKKYSDIREYIEDSTSTPVQARMASAILNLSKFVENIGESADIVRTSTHAKAFQDFISGASKVVEGESDKRTINALDLIKLIHNEFNKVFKISGTRILNAEQVKELADKITQKALKNKDKYADLDIDKDSKACALYLDGALSVSENENYIMRLCAICKLYQEALREIKRIRVAHVSLQMTRSAIGNYFEGDFPSAYDFVVGDTEEATAILTQHEQAIEKMLRDRSLDVVETSEKIIEYAEQVVNQYAQEQQGLIKLEEDIENIRANLKKHASYYGEVIDKIPEYVASAKQKYEFGEDSGLIDGCNVIVEVSTTEHDVITGDVKESEPKTEKLTDVDFIDTLFNRGLVPASEYTSAFLSLFNSVKSLNNLQAKVSEFSTKSDKFCEKLEHDYTYLLDVYEKLLKAVKVIKQHPELSAKAREKYFENLYPVWPNKYGGKYVPMISEEAIERLKEVFKIASKNRQEEDESVNGKILKICAESLISYVNSCRRIVADIDGNIERRFSYDAITKGAENIEDGHIINIKFFSSAIESEIFTLNSLDTGKFHFERLDNRYVFGALSFISLPVYFEIHYEFLKTGLGEGTLSGVYGGNYEGAMLKADYLNKLNHKALGVLKSTRGVECYDCIYEYVFHAVVRAKELLDKAKTQPRRGLIWGDSVIQYYEGFYEEWKERLRVIEEERRKTNDYVLSAPEEFKPTQPKGGVLDNKPFVPHSKLPNFGLGDMSISSMFMSDSILADALKAKSTSNSEVDIESMKTGDPVIDSALEDFHEEGLTSHPQFAEAFKSAVDMIKALGGTDKMSLEVLFKIFKEVSDVRKKKPTSGDGSLGGEDE